MQVRGEIGQDGTLRLAVPVGLPAGSADVLIVVQPDPAAISSAVPTVPPRTARSGLFADDVDSRTLDVDAALREMSSEWPSKLSDAR